jgi:opacity protein-like surface antigen
MKKSLTLIVLLMVLCFCTSSYGADAAGHRWYVGIGGSWAADSFDTDDLDDDFDEIGLKNVDFDDAWGVNASVGYHVNDNFSMAFVYSYLSGFDSDESTPAEDVLHAAGIDEDDLADVGIAFFGLDPADVDDFLDAVAMVDIDTDIQVDIMTFMLEGKFAMSGNLSPYGVLGIGLMYADADGDLKAKAPGVSVSIAGDSDSDTKACWKVGLGVDWWATPDVTIGLEGSYVASFGDLEFDTFKDIDYKAEMGIRYWNVGLGIAYHF